LFHLELGGPWTARVFFVWVSVINLFAISIFWSFMGDVFTQEESRRLYGSVAAGGSAGAIAGPAFTAILAQSLGPIELLPVSALSLLFALGCAQRLTGRCFPDSESAGDRVTMLPRSVRSEGGGALGKPQAAVCHPYLRGVSIFVILYAVLSTFLYFEQAEILSREIPDRGRRTAAFALMDLAVNVLTIGAQLFATSRVVGRFGLPATLAAVPLAVAAGFVLLAVFPVAATLLPFQIMRRAGNYALTRPGREMLFAGLPPAGRYQTKSFIDTVVYRGGDALGGWIVAGVSVLGLSMAPLAVPLALAWAGCGIWLGRRQEKVAALAE
jgi:AAA family ATP:ADP antiporter